MSTSPSQIKTAGLCVRKWGWEKLESRVGRSSPAAELGDAVHKRLEQYLTGRVWFKGDLPGQIADRAIPFLPRCAVDDLLLRAWRDLPHP